MDHPNLKAIAEQAMRERGFLVKSPQEAIEQLKTGFLESGGSEFLVVVFH